MTNSFAGLDDLNLVQHGDVRERDLWPPVSKTLSQYESFWRALIVLLSNRIETSIPFEDPKWIQARSKIPCVYERLAMHSYSLFYFTARARQAIEEDRLRVESRNYPHPEIVFFYLHGSVENAEQLKLIARDILRDLGMSPKFPRPGALRYETIRKYRDAFTHDPILGRRIISHAQELLPPETRLPRKGDFLLWRETARIPTSDMIDELKLEDRLWQRLSTFLQNQWECLTEEFVRARQCEKFLADLRLAELLPIRRTTPNTLWHANTVGASGTFSSSPGPGYFSFPARSDAPLSNP
jgi:hypothetical protein